MGKPLAGQLGQMGSQTQSQRGGGFGGQQSLSLQKPMQPQMPQQNPGGFGNGMGINIAQPPQQSGGLLGSLSPQQPTYGGFGNGIGINIAQPPQSGTQAMPQQDMLNAQQLGQAFAQMQQQMPQMPMPQMPIRVSARSAMNKMTAVMFAQVTGCSRRILYCSANASTTGSGS